MAFSGQTHQLKTKLEVDGPISQQQLRANALSEMHHKGENTFVDIHGLQMKDFHPIIKKSPDMYNYVSVIFCKALVLITAPPSCPVSEYLCDKCSKTYQNHKCRQEFEFNYLNKLS